VRGFLGVACVAGVVVAAALLLPAGAASLRAVLPVSVMEIEPWGMTSEQSDPQHPGIYTEMITAIAGQAGLTIALSIKPYPRTIVDMRSGESVFTLMSNNPGIEQAAVRLAAVKPLDVVVMGPGGKKFSSLADLRGKKVATLLGTDHDPRFRDDPLILKVTVKSTEQQLKLLEVGRVDAIFGVSDAIAYTAGKMRRAGHPVALGEPLLVTKLYGYLYLSKQHDTPAMREALLGGVAKLKAAGTLERINAKYLADVGR